MTEKYELPQYITKALSMLNTAGHEAFVVGGYVRDMLRGVEAGDCDITTSALPSQTAEVFADYQVIETGIKHGTVTVLMPDGDIRQPLEITTYRIDGSYTDSRHPSSVTFTSSLAEDLKRRDFTVNAMAYNRDFGDVVDLYGGRDDLENRVIRCVGDPRRRFSEDALRILRALRFASVLDFSVDGDTSDAVIGMCGELNAISAERIYVELKKLVSGTAAGRVLAFYRRVFDTVLPGFADIDAAEYDKMTAAFGNTAHDVSDGLCLMLYPLGGKAVDVMHRLKADNASTRSVVGVCSFEGELPKSIGDIRRLCAKIGFDDARRLGFVRRMYGDEGAAEFVDAVGRIEADGDCITPKQLKIDGNKIAELGISGKNIGRVMYELLRQVIDGETVNESETLRSRALEIFSSINK